MSDRVATGPGLGQGDLSYKYGRTRHKLPDTRYSAAGA